MCGPPIHRSIDCVVDGVVVWDSSCTHMHSAPPVQTRLPVYYGHTPAGTSVKNMLHFAQVSIYVLLYEINHARMTSVDLSDLCRPLLTSLQEVKSGKFEMYDYREASENKKHYNGRVSH